MDYTQITTFATKDALATGHPDKIVKGAEYDPEFSAISAAIASKYDSDDVANNAEAAALSSDAKLITPAKLAYALANGSHGLATTSSLSSYALASSLSAYLTTSAAAAAYAPLGGAGASGTWAINISGNAATASFATSASSASTATSATTAGSATSATTAGSITGQGSMATKNHTISSSTPSGGVDGDLWFRI